MKQGILVIYNLFLSSACFFIPLKGSIKNLKINTQLELEPLTIVFSKLLQKSLQKTITVAFIYSSTGKKLKKLSTCGDKINKQQYARYNTMLIFII